MPKMTFSQTIGLSIALQQDACGNVICGQSPERILSYLGSSLNVLRALQVAFDSKDVRDNKMLQEIIHEAFDMIDRLPEWNNEAASIGWTLNYKLCQPGMLNSVGSSGL